MRKDIVINMEQSQQSMPIAQLVALANKYESKIYFEKETKKINAKSIMGMMSLVLNSGVSITIDAEGNDAEDAIVALEDFLVK